MMTGRKKSPLPAGRADITSVRHDSETLGKTGLIDHISQVVPSAMMVLNKERQVVFKNQQLMDLLATSSNDDVLGKRPGELLDCVHAFKNSEGCGTSTYCRQCGALRAVKASWKEKSGAKQDCTIKTGSGAEYEFDLHASHYPGNGREYTLVTAHDKGNRKRLEVLERIFLHNVNNILLVISGKADLLACTENKEEIAGFVEDIRDAAVELKREITSHRKLIEAENGDLSLKIECGISSLELVDELANMYARRRPNSPELQRGECDDFVLTTDRSLLLRILYSMVNNAAESSSNPGTVSVCCFQDDSSGVFSVRYPDFMPRTTQHQIFQRSFSAEGRERGIETYSMKLIGEKYLGGKVWFSTSGKKGTTFFISVPLVFDGF